MYSPLAGDSSRENDRPPAHNAQGEHPQKSVPPFGTSAQNDTTSQVDYSRLLRELRQAKARIMELEALAAQGGELPPAVAQAMHAKDDRIAALEAESKEVRNFVTSKMSSPRIVSWLRLRYYWQEHPDLPTDEQGRKYTSLETVARKYGGSADSIGDGLNYFHRLGLVDKDSKTTCNEQGQYTTKVSALPLVENVQAVHRLSRQEVGNNQGGKRCPTCGHAMKAKTIWYCPVCDGPLPSDQAETGGRQIDPRCEHPAQFSAERHTAPLLISIDTDRQIAPRCPDATEKQEGEKVLSFSLPVTPSPALDTLSREELKAQAAALLVSLNMGEATHRWMQHTTDGRYTTVHRPLSPAWAREHIEGTSTRGLVPRPNAATTRALVGDADTPERKARLLSCGKQLAAAGWRVLVNTSPFFAEHPGAVHLWAIFDGEVSTRTAWAEAVRIAPALAQEKEWYPKVGMRLLCGRYRGPGLAAWPTLHSLNTGARAQYGPALWRLLLSHVNSSGIIPALPRDEPAPVIRSTILHTSSASAGFYRVFAAEHPMPEILPLQPNGYAFAVWRGERSASVAYKDGRWYDNGNTGAWVSSGDAFDLWVLTHCAVTPATFDAVKRAERLHCMAISRETV
jgi:hypothetical protein